MQSILITGASGFIGSFLVEEGLNRGFEVWAAVRPTSSREYLTDARIHFIELDLSADEPLRAQLAAHVKAHGAWDYVIHAAGATKCARKSDFFRVNTDGTLRLARLLLEEKALAGRFVFMSTLSVFGPIHERSYNPIKLTDHRRPNTAYGRSKMQAERGLAKIQGLDYVMLRPTGVYGPRERDYYEIAKSLKGHFGVGMGYRRQAITFIYVRDLVAAAFSALTRGKCGKGYLLTDGGEYTSRQYCDLLQREMHQSFVFHYTSPVWIAFLICAICGGLASLFGRTALLNLDKFRIMRQRNWTADISESIEDLAFSPKYTLEMGVRESVAWYKKHGWL